jgi:thiol-disulfide isomerase/thioredoxin/cytochrome c biogenesis protein CcdA
MILASLDVTSALLAHPAAALLTVYAGGVVTSLTRCLYPMVPVTVSIVAGSRGATRRSTRMSLAATYVVGLASTYAGLGLVAGLTGTLFGAISTNPWLLFVMANVMLAAAAMMADAIRRDEECVARLPLSVRVLVGHVVAAAGVRARRGHVASSAPRRPMDALGQARRRDHPARRGRVLSHLHGAGSRMIRHLFTITIISTIALLAPERASAQEAGIALASSAPAASVVTLDGKQVDLASYIGRKPVVLEFWATWCPLCKQLESQMQEAREVFGDRVTFVSVGVRDNQTAEKQKAYADAKHIGGELVFDRDGKAVAAYKVPHTSYLVVVDASGKVVYTGVGAEQNVKGAIARALAPANGMSHDGM